jgi:hypothetical protein
VLSPAEHYTAAERLLAARPLPVGADGGIDLDTDMEDDDVNAALFTLAVAAVHYLAAHVPNSVANDALDAEEHWNIPATTPAEGPTL